eukprot:scaffold5588_cov78-Skeletonema_dohrnii-CCMP3373.AAC.1
MLVYLTLGTAEADKKKKKKEQKKNRELLSAQIKARQQRIALELSIAGKEISHNLLQPRLDRDPTSHDDNGRVQASHLLYRKLYARH